MTETFDPTHATAKPATLVRTMSTQGGILVRCLVGGELLESALSLRPMASTAANALGRALMGAVLLAVGQGEEQGDEIGENVQLQIQGDGPLGSIVAISDSRGRVRGMVSNPTADNRLASGGPDVARAVGLGRLSVVRHRPGVGRPYSGTVPLTSGEIAGDLTLYLAESEQTPSAVGLGVDLSAAEDGIRAAGFLVQELPGAESEEIDRVEGNIRNLPPLSELASKGMTADGLTDLLLAGVGSRERHIERPIFFCPCTRSRAQGSLALLGRDELREMVLEEVTQEVRCEFCGRAYNFSTNEIGSVLPNA